MLNYYKLNFFFQECLYIIKQLIKTINVLEVKKWQQTQTNQNVAQPKQKMQKKKKVFFKNYGASFSDATVIRH